MKTGKRRCSASGSSVHSETVGSTTTSISGFALAVAALKADLLHVRGDSESAKQVVLTFLDRLQPDRSPEEIFRDLVAQEKLDETLTWLAEKLATDDEADWHGEGMVIIRANSLAEAKQVAANDPMHKSGARTYRVRPWLMNEGSFTVKVTYSDQKHAVE